MSKLKPCPFCGYEARVGYTGNLVLHDKRTFYVTCTNERKACGMIVYSIASKTSKGAIKKWNKRKE